MTNDPQNHRPYELKVEERGDYLYASVTSDESSREAVDAYIAEIAAECAQIQCHNLLIEKDVPDALWVWDSMAVIGQFALNGLGETRVALVDRSVKRFEDRGFGVEIGRSTVDLHVFSNFAAGESWLTHH